MDIPASRSTKKPASIASTLVQSFNLKVNQQLKVKVLSSDIKKQSITLQIPQPKQTIRVQSNLPIETTAGQTLKVQVSKLSPAAEFKVISTDTDNQIDLKKLTLKQIILQPANTQTHLDKAVLHSSITATVIAKIISISADTVLLKLPSQISAEGINNKQQQLLLNQGSTIQLSRDQLSQKHLPGEKIQLEISKKGTQLDYKILESKALNLKNGQILSATVIKMQNHSLQIKIPGNRQSISLENDQFININSKGNPKSESSLPILKKGDKISLEVIKKGNQTQFKLVNKQTNSEQLIQQTFKQNLPKQQQPEVLLNQIIQQLPNINKSANIPDTLKRLAREILDSLEHKDIQQAKLLKKAMSNSGLFLEAKLAKTDEQSNLNIHPDFKNKLFKFNQALKHSLGTEQKLNSGEINLIKELQQKTENSLAKVILNQLASLPKEDTSRQVWILDLPFLNKESADSIEIKITREQANRADEDPENWAVTITISPPGLGTIYCNVSCYDKTVNTIFWSDTQHVVSKINHHLDYLKSQFEIAGIETGHMSAQSGTPPPGTHQQVSHQDSHLVNHKV